jgi:hypothetical protein
VAVITTAVGNILNDASVGQKILTQLLSEIEVKHIHNLLDLADITKVHTSLPFPAVIIRNIIS